MPELYLSYLRNNVRLLARRLPVVAGRLTASNYNANHSRLLRPSYPLRLCRMMSTPVPQVNASDLSIERYHILSDTTMDTLLESLENLLDDLGNPDYEVEYHSGVLTLLLGEKGTYVINKQPPNKQIWLSSPFSGPKRYDYSEVNDNWLYSRDGHSLGDLLNDELSKALNQTVDIRLGPSSHIN
ncbi:Frataxin, mitochondrial [Hypsizygus marmoreus]|uniref:ferroxidase n=1 Tax=Hypsizygus marmoreus TaxID=39966 RepID=A0A369K7N3_HYPMA|nr:Frataxin, mitochondrial [Hypsizygus marmoreus]